MKLSKIIILSIVVMIVNSCVLDRKPDANDLMIRNDSDSKIYVFSSSDDSYGFITDNQNKPRDTYDSAFVEYSISAKDSNIMLSRPDRWDQFSDKKSNKNRLRIFIVTEDSVKKYGLKKIFKENIYTRLYYLSKEDLDKIGWRLYYNGKR
jgi:hypothetical protein